VSVGSHETVPQMITISVDGLLLREQAYIIRFEPASAEICGGVQKTKWAIGTADLVQLMKLYALVIDLIYGRIVCTFRCIRFEHRISLR
jgi:hypothetical protein